jgi:hypothetical protein
VNAADFEGVATAALPEEQKFDIERSPPCFILGFPTGRIVGGRRIRVTIRSRIDARRLRRAAERAASKSLHRPLAFEPLEPRAVFSSSPYLVSLVGVNPEGLTTAADTVAFTAVFSSEVTGVDAADFALAMTGSVSVAVKQVTAVSSSTYTITLSGVAGDGTLGLNLVDDGSIRSLPGAGLVTPGTPLGFTSYQSIGVGASAQSIVTGDLNGDGNIDLVTTLRNTGGVGILLGNGNGTFQSQQSISVGASPFFLTSGDINGDGRLDIVVNNAFGRDGMGTLLLGNGNGTFQAPLDVAIGSSAWSVIATDVNGDGKLDLLSAQTNYSSINLLLGNGDGTFQAAQSLAATRSAAFLASGDVNGDGKVDIVVSHAYSVSVLLGNGDGSFQPFQTYASGAGAPPVVVADFNGDGKLDIATASPNQLQVSVLLGNGDGTFAPRQTFIGASGAYGLYAADLDGDGKVDLTIAGRDGGRAYVFLGNGDGAFQAVRTFGAGGSPVSFAIVDLNNDGKLDIAVGNQSNNRVGTLLNTANGNFTGQVYTIDNTNPTVTSIVRTSPAGPDFNGSGVSYTVTFGETVTGVDLSDFIVARSGTATGTISQVIPVSGSVYTVTIGGITGDGTIGLNLIDNGSIHDAVGNGLQSASASTFLSQQTFAVANSPTFATTADVNGDGKLDLISTIDGSGVGDAVDVWLGNGNGTFQALRSFATNLKPRSVVVGDVNGDGKSDLVVAGYNGFVSVHFGNGDGTFQAAQTGFAGSNLTSIVLGDFDGDTRLDVAATNADSSQVALLLGNGNGTFKTRTSFEFGNTITSLGAADFNGDGKLDLAVANNFNVVIRLGTGTGTFQSVLNVTTGAGPTVFQTLDLNGDGKLDIVSAGNADGKFSVVFGNGNGTFKAPQTSSAGIGAISLELRDVNGDGKVDAMVGIRNAGADSVVVSAGNGNGTFQAPQSTSLVTARDVQSLGDFNGDGRLDLGVSLKTVNTVSMLQNVGTFIGPTYNIDHTTPTLLSIVKTSTSTGPTSATSVSFTVTFSEAMVGIDAADFAVDASAGVTASSTLIVTAVNASTYTVTVVGIAGQGTIGIKYLDGAGNTDSAGNRLSAWQAQQTFAVGTSVYSIAKGDVDNDGILDLAVVDFATNSMAILIGNGDGTFKAQQTRAVGSQPLSIALADLNADGKLDAIVANSNSTNSTIGVLFGNGNGTFKAQQTFAADLVPDSLTIADIDGDGKLDIGFIARSSVRAAVLFGNGDGTFDIYRTYAVGTTPFNSAFGDLNGDGKLDIVVGAGGSVRILIAGANRTFSASQSLAAGSGVNYVSLGDVNGDGKLDIVVADNSGGLVRTMLGNGNGTFQVAQTFAAGADPYTPSMADLNSDGKLDIVVGNVESSSVSILYGNGDGTFQARQSLAAGAGSTATVIGDWNGDAKPDVAVVDRTIAAVGVFLSGVGGAFASPRYTIDNVAPNLVSIVQTTPSGSISNARTLVYTVTFDGPVVGVDLSDFVLATTGTVYGTISQVTPTSGAVYQVTVSGVGGDGTLALRYIDTGSVRDPAGNRLTPVGTQISGFLATRSLPATLDIIAGAKVDFNGDGLIDLVSGGDNVIGIGLGNGDGTFKSPLTFAASNVNGIGSFIAADFNNDGKLDIVGSDSTTASLLLLGNGDGTFRVPPSQTAVSANAGIDVGDVNGDGNLDIIAANYGPTRASILLGNGNGTFQAARTYDVGTLPSAMAARDVDGDGKIDLIVMNNNVLSVLRGNGDATFEARQTFGVAGGTDMATGDFDGDGHLDLAAPSYQGGTVNVVFGNGGISFRDPAAFTAGLNPASVGIVDLNNDGKLDLVVAGNGVLSAFYGNGNGTFVPRVTFAVGASPRSLSFADINNDGRLDIVTAGSVGTRSLLLTGSYVSSATVTLDHTVPQLQSIVRNSPAAAKDVTSVSYTVTFSESVSGVDAADFTLSLAGFSSTPQVAVTAVSGSVYTVTVSGIIGDGTVGLNLVDNGTIRDAADNRLGAYQQQQTIAAGNSPQAFAMGDLNGDGKLDIALVDTADNKAGILLGNGDGTFLALQTYTVGAAPISITLADLNNDGRLDLVVSDSGGASVEFLLGNGNGTFQARQALNTSQSTSAVTTADLNGDGKVDLLVANPTSALFNIFLGNGNGSFQARQSAAISNGAAAITVGDFNADGKVDVALANGTADVINILLGNGNGTFKAFQTKAAGQTAGSIAVGDVNADGKADLVVTNQDDGTIGIFLGNGNGTFQNQTTFAAGGAPRGVKVGDVDGDGKADLLVALQGDNGAALLLGNGNGTFQTAQSFAVGAGPTAVAAGDVNGDGVLDIVAAASVGNTISVLLGSAQGTFVGPVYTVDQISPTVTIVRTTPVGTLSSAATASYTIIFSETVTGVDASDFIVAATGTAAGSITQFSAVSGSIYTLTVSSISGDGQLGVNLVDDGTIRDVVGHRLDAAGAATFTGPTYHADRTAPTVASIVRGSPMSASTNAASVSFLVTFAEAVTGVDAADFAAATTGSLTSGTLVVSGTGASYTVTVNGLSGTGMLTLGLATGKTIQDLIGNTLTNGAPGGANESYAIDTVAPTVVGVYAVGVGIGSANWNASFLAYLATNGLGDASLGYLLSTGGTQLKTLPWSNVNTISLRFSEEVTVTQNDLTVVGAANGPTVPEVVGFAWDTATHTGTWTFAAALPRNKYLLHVGATIVDLGGNALDGEWTVASSTRSGDGTAGGDFNFRFNVLPGDFDGNNGVTITEVLQARNRAGKGTASIGYAYREDMDGNGNITITEVLASRNRSATSITGLNEPVAPGSTPQSPLELAPLIPGEEEGLFVSPYAALTEAELVPIVDEAIRRWEASGLVPEGFDWSKLRFAITDLGPAYLGLGNPDGSILLDDDGAGWGWFVDDSPRDDLEFATEADDVASHMDLLTVVMHEIGHALGYPTGSAQDTQAAALMSQFLGVGTRRSPGTAVNAVLSDLLADDAQTAPMLGFARLTTFDYRPLALGSTTCDDSSCNAVIDASLSNLKVYDAMHATSINFNLYSVSQTATDNDLDESTRLTRGGGMKPKRRAN